MHSDAESELLQRLLEAPVKGRGFGGSLGLGVGGPGFLGLL